MSRQNSSSRSNSERNQPKQISSSAQNRAVDFDIQRELDRLEELILDSPRIPLTRRTLVDEYKLLNQLDLVRMSLPDAFEKALGVIQQQQEILEEAENYATNMVEMAKQKAEQILDQTGIIQQAEREALQIRQQLQEECEAVQRKTIAEIEQMRLKTQQELQQFRQQTITECHNIQADADEYADAVLNNIEDQLTNALKIIHNGRQQLTTPPPAPPRNSAPKKLPGNPRKQP